MDDQEKLQYALDNYSIGDKISRRGFGCNRNTVIIGLSSTRKENKPYFYNTFHIFFGSCQIYCGEKDVWAVNLTKKQIINHQYEIY